MGAGAPEIFWKFIYLFLMEQNTALRSQENIIFWDTTAVVYES